MSNLICAYSLLGTLLAVPLILCGSKRYHFASEQERLELLPLASRPRKSNSKIQPPKSTTAVDDKEPSIILDKKSSQTEIIQVDAIPAKNLRPALKKKRRSKSPVKESENFPDLFTPIDEAKQISDLQKSISAISESAKGRGAKPRVVPALEIDVISAQKTQSSVEETPSQSRESVISKQSTLEGVSSLGKNEQLSKD